MVFIYIMTISHHNQKKVSQREQRRQRFDEIVKKREYDKL